MVDEDVLADLFSQQCKTPRLRSQPLRRLHVVRELSLERGTVASADEFRAARGGFASADARRAPARSSAARRPAR